MLKKNAFVKMRKCKVFSLMRGLIRTIFLLLAIISFLLSLEIRNTEHVSDNDGVRNTDRNKSDDGSVHVSSSDSIKSEYESESQKNH